MMTSGGNNQISSTSLAALIWIKLQVFVWSAVRGPRAKQHRNCDVPTGKVSLVILCTHKGRLIEWWRLCNIYRGYSCCDRYLVQWLAKQLLSYPRRTCGRNTMGAEFCCQSLKPSVFPSTWWVHRTIVGCPTWSADWVTVAAASLWWWWFGLHQRAADL